MTPSSRDVVAKFQQLRESIREAQGKGREATTSRNHRRSKVGARKEVKEDEADAENAKKESK